MNRRLTSILLAAASVTLVASALPATAAATAPPRQPTPSGVGASPDPSFGPAAREAALARAQSKAPAVAQSLGLSRAESLTATNVERDVDGTQHLRYDRSYAGLPVIGGDMVVHTAPDGSIDGVEGTVDGTLGALVTKPGVGARQAQKTVAGRVRLASGSVSGSELVVWAVRSVPRLAWQVRVKGTDGAGGPVRRLEFVDAATGAYIAGWSELEAADGKGKSLYSGTVPLKTVKVNGKFVMKDTTRGNATVVDVFNNQDPNGGYLAGTIFKDADNVWGNFTNSSRQSAAADAAYGGAKTWDYFKNTFGRAGIRGDGVGAKSRVHYDQGLDNAFWDDNCFCMTYGDGGDSFKSLVSLDVAGHEMTHGITSNTAGLIYFGESGGLNEATSDIFGTMVEFSAANSNDPGDYYIGEKVVKPAFGHPSLRRMDKPSTDGFSYDCWVYGMGKDDVHFTSGPANHFFYLLAEGTASKTIGGRQHSTNTCGTGASFGGIGRATAAKIWYRALSAHLTSASGYIEARDATIQAAKELFPGTPATCAAVVRAWNSVKVPAGYWTCDGPLDEGASTISSNAGFENGSTDWSLGGTAFVTGDPGWGFPRGGDKWANFNGRNQSNTSTVTRSVSVPNTGTAMLRFYMLIYTEEGTSSTEYDTFDVLVNGSKIGETGHWSNLSADNTYIRWDVPMAAYAGQTVTLQFKGVEDSSGSTQFLVDDVTLTPR